MLKTLRSKLILFFMIATFLPVLLVAYLTFYSQKETLSNQIEQMVYIFADSVAISMENFIKERLSDTATLAGNPELSSNESSRDAIRRQLKSFSDTHELYTNVLFINTEGIVIADLDNRMVGLDLSERQWVEAGLNGEPYFSDVYLSDYNNGPTYNG